MTVVLGWYCNAVAGHEAVTGPSINPAAASALPAVDLKGVRHIAGKTPPIKTDVMGESDRHVASLMGVSHEAYLATRNIGAKEA